MFAFVLIVASVFTVLAPSKSVGATTYCSGSYKGRNSCDGYFSGANGHADDVSQSLINGGTNATNANQFIDKIHGLLYNDSEHNRVGAAFIIANMMGKDGTDFSSKSNGVNYAKDNFDEWAERVRTYQRAGFVDWTKSIYTGGDTPDMGGGSGWYRNSSWFGGISDAAFHNKVDETITVIEFDVPGGGHFRLEKACLNLVGKLSELELMPATIDPQSLVNGQGNNDVVVDAASGATRFEHRIKVTNYRGMNHNVKYEVQRSTNTDNTCNAPWVTVPGSAGTLRVTGNGTTTVWGETNVTWPRDTTKRICQQLVINRRDQATITGSNPAERWATIRSGTITVSNSSDPIGDVEPGQAFSMNGKVIANGVGLPAFNLTYVISYSVSGGDFVLDPPVAVSGSTVINGTTQEFSNPFSGSVPVTAQAGAIVCVSARVTVPDPLLARYFSGSASPDPVCIRVVHKPVFNVNGGDVYAGGKYEDPVTGACTGGTTADIKGWNSGVLTSYSKGAGGQLAAFATGSITGFATARSAVGVDVPSGLAFTNTPGFPNGEMYGGGIENGAVPCISDHWTVPDGVTPISVLGIGSGASGKYSISGGGTISSDIHVANGVKQIIYVDGDLDIRGNIIYDGRAVGWLNLASIPGLKFVVSGKIIISNNVTQMDGIYAATGDIRTCEVAIGNDMYSGCNNKLTVNGAFITRGRVIMMRTNGTSLDGTYAEEFNFLPEAWLARWPSTTTSGGSTGKYDAITALPPVL